MNRGVRRRWQPAWIGLGSNLGDRLSFLGAAVQALGKETQVKVKRVSSVYLTSPVGHRRQRWFYNAVVLLVTRRSPASLLNVLLHIERTLGRRRSAPGAPRTIDLDLLMHGTRVVTRRRLCVPHPRFHERAFVLAPFVEVNEHTVHPVLKVRVGHLLRGLKTRDVTRKQPRGVQRRFHVLSGSAL